MSIATKIIQYNTNGATFSVQKQLVITTVSTGYVNIEAGGVTDHGALTGLADDDHTQYHNDARGDIRYYTKAQVDSLVSAAELSDGDKGDITVSGGAAVWTIDDNVVTNAKAANMPANTLKGNNTGSIADPADLTVLDVKTLLNYTSADISGFGEAVDDRVASLLVAGTNITLTYNDVANTLTIDASGGGGGSGVTSGTSSVSFGATATNEAQVVVTGQSGILAGSKVIASIGTTATSDYTANDHKYLGSMGVSVTTGDVIAGTGFTIYVRSYQKLTGDISINWVY